MVPLVFTRNASFFSEMTSTTVQVVGQTKRLRRLRFRVRVPARSGPNGFIQRHWGLHSGIRRKSEISAQTFEAGASTSTCVWSSAATIGPPGWLVVVQKGFQSGLCAAGAPAGGG